MYKVVDLFCGAGGFAWGFANNPEFEIVGANDFDSDAAKAYQLNYPITPMICGDIAALDKKDFEDIGAAEGIDVIIGGPPCQSYSTLGKRQNDERANLFKEYKRVLGLLQPRLFVFENVTGLLSMQKGKLFTQILEEFKEIGYDLSFCVADAADYGVPQHRKRIFLVGMKGKNVFTAPAPTHGEGLKPWVTFGDALGDLPHLKPGEAKVDYATAPQNDFQKFVRDTDELTEFAAPRSKPELIELMQVLEEGQAKSELPNAADLPKSFHNSYAKLWWDRPSDTITRNFGCPSCTRCIHPRESRALSNREGARLQSFPDSYQFYGTVAKKRLQIGNAIPPLMSKIIADQVLKALKEENN